MHFALVNLEYEFAGKNPSRKREFLFNFFFSFWDWINIDSDFYFGYESMQQTNKKLVLHWISSAITFREKRMKLGQFYFI